MICSVPRAQAQAVWVHVCQADLPCSRKLCGCTCAKLTCLARQAVWVHVCLTFCSLYSSLLWELPA